MSSVALSLSGSDSDFVGVVVAAGTLIFSDEQADR